VEFVSHSIFNLTPFRIGMKRYRRRWWAWKSAFGRLCWCWRLV